MLTVIRACEEAIHLACVGIRAGIGDKCFHLIRRWRDARKVQSRAAQEGTLVGVRAWLKAET